MEHYTILIVEDSSFVNNTLKDNFVQKGHKCEQAYTLKEALNILTNLSFDYIILDLHLPDAEDEALVSAIQQASKSKIFILTNQNDRQVRELIFRYGIVDYFLKDDSFKMNIDAIDLMMRSIPQNNQHKILCIDDSKLTQKHIALTLEPRNYTLISAYTAQEAQDQFVLNDISLIILDMELPDLHGSKLLKLIKVNPRSQHIPIIVLSGTISPDIVSMVIKAGANDYIEKPFNNESFLLKISRLIEQFEKDREILKLNKVLESKVQEEISKNQAQQVAMLHQSKLAQMGEMISMIAHQWRQPLSAITSVTANLALLNFQKKLNGALLEKEINKIDQYAQHLSQTITDFRNFFKSDSKQEEMDFAHIVQSVLDIIGHSLKAKNINCIFENHCDAKIYSFPHELKQVILNLIKNSEDAFMEESIEDPRITIKIYQSGEFVIYEQLDNAGGIKAEPLSDIFNPYFSTKRDKDGTGLGLYMSQTIIKEHCKGEIRINNHLDGTLCRIKIPSNQQRAIK